jgi:hypothetical protein
LSRRLTTQERIWRAVPESDVVRAVLDYAQARGAYCWRNNTGSVTATYNGKERFIRFSEKGAADVFCIYRGRFIAFETKRELGVVSETQHAWRQQIEQVGGLWRRCRPSDYETVIDAALAAIDQAIDTARAAVGSREVETST